MKGRVTLVALCAAVAPCVHAQTPPRLTLADAEKRAVDNHPQVHAAEYAAQAAGEGVREARAAFFPMVQASFTAAGAQDGTRIAAGGLNNPTILDRFAGGFAVSQLLTDFGRTSDLASSASLRADAQKQSAFDTRAAVILRVDRAYFNALRAQAVLQVARRTVETRQLVVDQVTALAASKLKSALDVSFARVNLGQAQLLLVQAENDVQAASATLAAALGSSAPTSYSLVDEPMPPMPSDSPESLVAQALAHRPDVTAYRLSEEAALKLADSERKLWYPSIAAVGAAGVTPFHQVGLTDRYSALGVNVSVPVLNGNLYAARHAEAAFRAQAEEQSVHDLENRVTRDVRIAWLDMKTAYQRVDLTNQVLAQASDALDLAQARYNLGLSSIVELTQAELQKTQAEIDQASARYEYQAQAATLAYQLGVRK